MKSLPIEVQKWLVISIYTVVVALIVAFVLTTILIKKKVILRYSNNGFKRFFSHPLLYYSLKRIGSAIISILLAIIATFLLLRMRVEPQRFCDGLFIKYPIDTQEMLCQRLLENMGYVGSNFSQLIKYLIDILPFPKYICSYQTGVCNTSKAYWGLVDFGNGLYSTQQTMTPLVNELIVGALPPSVIVGFIGLVVNELIGYPFGVLMAKYKDKAFDRLGNAAIIVVFAIPTVVFYYLLKEIFTLMGFPMLYSSINKATLIAPGLIMGIGSFWSTGLWVRRYMVDEFGSDYVKFARAKGVPENTIMFKHVLRNAIIPLIRSIPAGILYCLVGSFFIEKIYNINGIGLLLYNALYGNNFAIVQAVVVFSSIISIVATVSGDILTALCDPRITLTSAND